MAWLYHEHISSAKREERFLLAVAFLLTTLLVRFITHSIKDRRFTWLFHNVGSSGGTHVHHLVFGISALLIAGYISAAFTPSRRLWRNVLAIVFGIGAALTLDEFALWLTLRDVYWSSEGRASVDALVLVGAFASLAAAGRALFHAMVHDLVVLARDIRRHA